MRHLGFHILSIALCAYVCADLRADDPKKPIKKRQLSPLAQRLEAIFFGSRSVDNALEIFHSEFLKNISLADTLSLKDAFDELDPDKSRQLREAGDKFNKDFALKIEQQALQEMRTALAARDPYKILRDSYAEFLREKSAHDTKIPYWKLNQDALHYAESEAPNAFGPDRSAVPVIVSVPKRLQGEQAVARGDSGAQVLIAAPKGGEGFSETVSGDSRGWSFLAAARELLPEAIRGSVEDARATGSGPVQVRNVDPRPRTYPLPPQGLNDLQASAAYSREFVRLSEEQRRTQAARNSFDPNRSGAWLIDAQVKMAALRQQASVDAYAELMRVAPEVFWIERVQGGKRVRLTPEEWQAEPRISPATVVRQNGRSQVLEVDNPLLSARGGVSFEGPHPRGGDPIVASKDWFTYSIHVAFALHNSLAPEQRVALQRAKMHHGLIRHATLAAHWLRKDAESQWRSGGNENFGILLQREDITPTVVRATRADEPFPDPSLSGEDYVSIRDTWRFMMLGGMAKSPDHWTKHTVRDRSAKSFEQLVKTNPAPGSIRSRISPLLAGAKGKRNLVASTVLGLAALGGYHTMPVGEGAASHNAAAESNTKAFNKDIKDPALKVVLYRFESSPAASTYPDRLIIAESNADPKTAQPVGVPTGATAHSVNSALSSWFSSNVITPIPTPPGHDLTQLVLTAPLSGKVLQPDVDYKLYRQPSGEYFVQSTRWNPIGTVFIDAGFGDQDFRSAAKDARWSNLDPELIRAHARKLRHVGLTVRADAFDALVHEARTENRPITHHEADAVLLTTADYEPQAINRSFETGSDPYENSARFVTPDHLSRYQCDGAREDTKLFYTDIYAGQSDIEIKPRSVYRLNDDQDRSAVRAGNAHTDVVMTNARGDEVLVDNTPPLAEYSGGPTPLEGEAQKSKVLQQLAQRQGDRLLAEKMAAASKPIPPSDPWIPIGDVAHFVNTVATTAPRSPRRADAGPKTQEPAGAGPGFDSGIPPLFGKPKPAGSAAAPGVEHRPDQEIRDAINRFGGVLKAEKIHPSTLGTRRTPASTTMGVLSAVGEHRRGSLDEAGLTSRLLALAGMTDTSNITSPVEALEKLEEKLLGQMKAGDPNHRSWNKFTLRNGITEALSTARTAIENSGGTTTDCRAALSTL